MPGLRALARRRELRLIRQPNTNSSEDRKYTSSKGTEFSSQETKYTANGADEERRDGYAGNEVQEDGTLPTPEWFRGLKPRNQGFVKWPRLERRKR